jgi:hypothetical protein
MPPKVGNRASESDYKNYAPKEVLFGPEADRRRKRTMDQVLSESRSRVGKGNIGQPAGQTPTPSPTKAPERMKDVPPSPRPENSKGIGAGIEDRERKALG